MTSTPCPPLAPSHWPDELDDLRQGFAGKLNVYRVMAHHPALLRAWAPLRQHVVVDTALGPERSEVVILRTGHRMGCFYEWAHHVSRARKLGFSEARIAAIRNMPEGEDGLIVQAVDAIWDNGCIPPAQEAELAHRIGRTAVIDLIATVGFYSVLGYLLQTYETPLDAEIARELGDRPLDF